MRPTPVGAPSVEGACRAGLAMQFPLCCVVIHHSGQPTIRYGGQLAADRASLELPHTTPSQNAASAASSATSVIPAHGGSCCPVARVHSSPRTGRPVPSFLGAPVSLFPRYTPLFFRHDRPPLPPGLQHHQQRTHRSHWLCAIQRGRDWGVGAPPYWKSTHPTTAFPSGAATPPVDRGPTDTVRLCFFLPGRRTSRLRPVRLRKPLLQRSRRRPPSALVAAARSCRPWRSTRRWRHGCPSSAAAT